MRKKEIAKENTCMCVLLCYQACQEFLDALGKSTTFVSRASQKKYLFVLYCCFVTKCLRDQIMKSERR